MKNVYLIFFSFLLLTACQTKRVFAPVNVAETGWKTEQGQAVWRVKKTAPEIAGDLQIATGPNGQSFVQFTKTPFPFVIAQTSTYQWQIEFPAQNKIFSGRGNPPAKLGPLPTGWLQLANCLKRNTPPKNWIFENQNGNFHLENRSTGESIEGFLAP